MKFFLHYFTLSDVFVVYGLSLKVNLTISLSEIIVLLGNRKFKFLIFHFNNLLSLILCKVVLVTSNKNKLNRCRVYNTIFIIIHRDSGLELGERH